MDMSETTEPTRRTPAVSVMTTITDSLGRTLEVKKLDALAELDLIEAAGGQNSENSRWMMMATFAACVITIDGAPYIFPRTREDIRKHMRRVGSEGIQAVIEWLRPDAQDVAAPADAEVAATAKN